MEPQYLVESRKNNLAIFDVDAFGQIEHSIPVWKLNRVVLVVSKSLYKVTDVGPKLDQILGPKVVGRKIGIGAHTPYSDVVELTRLIQEQHADCVLCVGSGSYSDAAKIASKLAATLETGFTEDDMESLVDQKRGTCTSLKPAAVTVILVPTSLSAGEWNAVGSCTNRKGKKQHFGCGDMATGAADLLIYDPALAMTTPSKLWLSSGVRCVDHCIETICNIHCTEEDERDARDGLRDMIKGLAAYASGQDKPEILRGISNAQKGSGKAIKSIILNHNSMGPSHAIGHQLGSIGKVGHGITSAILLGPVLKYTTSSEDPIFARAKICHANILATFNDTFSWNEEHAGDAVTRFCRELGLPTRLSEVNVTQYNQLEVIAQATLTDIWGGDEPQIKDKDEVLKILKMAM